MSGTTTSPEQRIKSGANWFYWIAALSLINTIMVIAGEDFMFIAGLGVTQVIDAVAAEFKSSAATVVALVLDLLALAMVAGLGYLAHRRFSIYVIGMVLYALDAVLYAFASAWLAVGFHGFVLFTMLPGMKAFGELRPVAEAPVFPSAPEVGPTAPQ